MVRRAGPTSVLAVGALLCAIALVPVWTLDRFPGQDTGNHLYAAHVLAHVDEAPFADYFRPYAITSNLAFLAFTAPLSKVLGLETAHRLFLSLYVIGFFAGALYLAAGTGRERLPLGLLVAPFVFNWYLGSGFYNFCISIPGFCFAVGLLLRHPAPSWRTLAVFALLGVLTAAGHPFTVACIGVAALAVLPTWRARFLAGAALLPAVLLVVFGVGSGAAPGGFDWPGGFGSPLYNAATAFYRFALPLGVDELPAALPAFLLLLVVAVYTAWRGRAQAPRSGLRLAAAMLALLFLLPERSFDLDHISTRVAVFLALAVPTFAGFGALLARPRLLLGIAATLSLSTTVLFWRSAAAVGDDLAEYTSGLEAVRPRRSLLFLTFDGRSGSRVVWPLLHAWGYYGIARDLVIPHVLSAHATRPGSLLAYRRDGPPLPVPDDLFPEHLANGSFCAGVRSALGDRGADCGPYLEIAWRSLAEKACAYDYVLAWAPPAELAARLSCLRPVHSRGRVTIFGK